MKAKVKKTGEIINISDYAKVVLDSCDSWGNPLELGFDEVEILQEKSDEIDWEQRRYEIAKEMLPHVKYYQRYRTDGLLHNLTMEESVKEAVLYADALIAELKKGGQE